MNNYQAERLAQDEKFDEQFTYIGETGFVHLANKDFVNRPSLKSYLLLRDTALLEAFKRDVGEMVVGLKKELWDDQDHAVGGYISRKEINNILKDYNPEK